MKKVLIVGQPNVGKSSLFNRLAKKRVALVLNQPGVTRDILKHQCQWWGDKFEVWDSGGLWAKDQNLSPLINTKVKAAISSADLILLVLCARTGLTDTDKHIFRMVRKSGKPCMILVNKIDDPKKTNLLLADFYQLGQDPLPCSFEQGHGVPQIIQWILKTPRPTGGGISPRLHSSNKAISQDTNKNNVTSHSATTQQSHPANNKSKTRSCKILVVGKPNVGKSSLCNALLKQDLALVSPVAGTTLDVLQESFYYHKSSYTLLDTAGVQKATKNKMQSLAQFKTQQNFKLADLILVLLDYSSGPDRASARLLELCAKEHKPVIVVVNKWDKKLDTDNKLTYRKNIQNKFIFYPDIPVVFVSALKAQGLTNLMKKVEEVTKKIHIHISTAKLNNFFMKVIRKTPSPVYGTQNVKLYYLTQTRQVPPSFIAFANYPEGIRPAYRRFLIRQIQKQWHLQGIPIRISFYSRRNNKSDP